MGLDHPSGEQELGSKVFLLVFFVQSKSNLLFSQGRPGNHSHSEDDKVDLDSNPFPQERIIQLQADLPIAFFGNRNNLSFGQKDPFVLLYPEIKIFVFSRGTNVLIEDIHFGLGVFLPYIEGLLEGIETADRRTVGKVLGIAGAGAQ